MTNVYVDGFNLYYGALKGTPHRWLNLSEMCRLMMPRDHINRIKYYTAKITALPRDPGQPVRQAIYLRALGTTTNLDIHYGFFLSHTVRMPLADGSGFAEVIKAEEKGSDVALAAQMVHDAHSGEYDTAIVISNDMDLLAPIDIVRRELGKKVGLICPYRFPCGRLVSAVDFVKRIRSGALRASQFPDVLTDANGTFHKPPTW